MLLALDSLKIPIRVLIGQLKIRKKTKDVMAKKPKVR